MDATKILAVNKKVEIALLDEQAEGSQIWGQSIIQELHDNSFAIMVPVKYGHAIHLVPGDRVIVAAAVDGVRYAFTSEVLDKTREASLMLVALKKPAQIRPSERRSLVRIKTLLPIKYSILEDNNRNRWELCEPGREAYAVDISGNGLCLSLAQPVAKNVLIVLEMHLETKTLNMRAKLLGEVVRCEMKDKHYRIGVKFLSIADREQGSIISYVCQSLRNQIRINRDDY